MKLLDFVKLMIKYLQETRTQKDVLEKLEQLSDKVKDSWKKDVLQNVVSDKQSSGTVVSTAHMREELGDLAVGISDYEILLAQTIFVSMDDDESNAVSDTRINRTAFEQEGLFRSTTKNSKTFLVLQIA